jgi:hypothetical protein
MKEFEVELKVILVKQVKVLDKYGCYETVSLAELHALLENQEKDPEVHHLNAVAEIGDPTYFPLITRVLQSQDNRVQRALAAIAVRLRLRELVPQLLVLSSKAGDDLTRSLLGAAAIYLEKPDRGLSLVLANDPLSFALLSNLLVVRHFDWEDFNLAAGAFVRFATLTKGRFSIEPVLNAINGLARALMTDEIQQKVSAQKADELGDALKRIRVSPIYRKLDKDGKEELTTIEEALEAIQNSSNHETQEKHERKNGYDK